MGFLKREVTTNVNPTSKFLEWKSNNKSFSFWNKELKKNEEVKLPLTFMVLEEYHKISGFSDARGWFPSDGLMQRMLQKGGMLYSASSSQARGPDF